MPPPHPHPRLLLLLDFDGTLTTHDTTPALASLAYAHPSPSPIPPWSHFTHAYLADLARYECEYGAGRRGAGTGKGKGIDGRGAWDEEVAYLRGLEAVERRSVERVEEAGVWAGLGRGEVRAGAEEAVRAGGVVMRRGAGRVLRWGLGLGLGSEDEGGAQVEVEMGVVSVNWSREWVRGVLRAGGAGVDDEDAVGVVANELDFDGGGGMGRFWGGGEEEERGGLWTSADKARVLREVYGVGGKEGRVSVYVGDSATDLEALMLVDVGIVIRDEEMGSSQLGLKEVLERVGVRCRWIGEFERGGERGLWWARDFDDVCDSPLLSTLRDGALES